MVFEIRIFKEFLADKVVMPQVKLGICCPTAIDEPGPAVSSEIDYTEGLVAVELVTNANGKGLAVHSWLFIINSRLSEALDYLLTWFGISFWKQRL